MKKPRIAYPGLLNELTTYQPATN